MAGSENEAEIIAAQGEADARRLEARAKLSPVAQIIYAISDNIGRAFRNVEFYQLIFGLIVLAYVLRMVFDIF